jgi:hypothetical protein
MTGTRPLSLAFLTLALASGPTGAWSLNCSHSAERKASIDTSGAERIEIIARAGDLTVRPATGSSVVAEGRACASSEAYLAQTQVQTRRQGNVVQVFVQVPDEVTGIAMLHASLDLTVQVPASLPTEVTDTSGDVTLENVRVTRLTDSSGDITARGLLGDIEISDSSGDIDVEDAAGLVRIVDSSGDIGIHGARDVLIPNDSSGDINIERVSGNVRIESDSSGDISIARVGQNVEIVADSTGDVHVSDVKGTVRIPKQ